MAKNTDPKKNRPKGKKISQLVQHLRDNGLRVLVVGSPDTVISRVNTLEDSEQGDITFLSNRKYIKLINQTHASAIILPETLSGPENLVQLKVDDSYYAMCLLTELIHGWCEHPFTEIDASAKIDPSAKIGKNARIASHVTICKNVTIGDNAIIYPGSFVGPDCRIGDNFLVYPNVTIYEKNIIGSNVIIHSGTVVGEDGFGYSTHKGIHHKIPPIGNVVIEDDVEIGANCAIDRATMGSTIIGKGTKFSNLIAIGHGTKIGPHCLLVAQVGIAGSARLGHNVTLGGQTGVAGHISLGDNVTAGAKSGIMKNAEDNQTLLGAPAMPIQERKRQILMVAKLPEMREQLKDLQKRLDKLEQMIEKQNTHPAKH